MFETTNQTWPIDKLISNWISNSSAPLVFFNSWLSTTQRWWLDPTIDHRLLRLPWWCNNGATAVEKCLVDIDKSKVLILINKILVDAWLIFMNPGWWIQSWLINKHLGPVGPFISYSLFLAWWSFIRRTTTRGTFPCYLLPQFQNSISSTFLEPCSKQSWQISHPFFGDLISDKNPTHFLPMPSGFEHGELQIQWFSDDNLGFAEAPHVAALLISLVKNRNVLQKPGHKETPKIQQDTVPVSGDRDSWVCWVVSVHLLFSFVH